MKRCGALLLIAVLLALAGCDDGGGESLDAPDYDLTGCWEVKEQPRPPMCEANVVPTAELRDSGIAFVDPLTDDDLEEVERGFVDADPLRLQQDNNDLAITETDSGHQVDGTISGDQVRWQDQEDLLDFETEWEARGTALTENVVALTITYEFASQEVEGAVQCEMRLERMIGASGGCVAAPDDETPAE